MYGGVCVCCGETEVGFLAIDHTEGGGNQHRKTFSTYYEYVRWLLKELRDGFRVLCYNCNHATKDGDPCPHQLRKQE